MPREIKYRAWDTQNKRMIDWRELLDYGSGLAEYFVNPRELIFLQHTGLKDKNGKEIYEGDITRRYWGDGSMQDGQIIFDHDSAQFCWQEISKEIKGKIKFIHPIGINTAHSEVIGDIYETNSSDAQREREIDGADMGAYDAAADRSER